VILDVIVADGERVNIEDRLAALTPFQRKVVENVLRKHTGK
jgi:hypothetical protein